MSLISESFSSSNYVIRKTFLKLFGSSFRIYDEYGRVVFFSNQKALRLKEDFRLFSDETMQHELLAMQARQILDIGVTFDIFDSRTKEHIGCLRRKGIKSMFRDEWLILGPDEHEIAVIQEESGLLAIFRRVSSWFSLLSPQTYIGRMGDNQIFRFRQGINPILKSVSLDYSFDQSGELDRRLGIAAGVLLCGIEGKQGGGSNVTRLILLALLLPMCCIFMLCLGPINFLLDPEQLKELRGGIEQLSNEIAVQELNNASWETVRNPGHTKKEYATALDNAEQAVKLAPEETHILNTLGVAQYRTGDYADSITTFARNETLAQNQKMAPHPSDLIFKAMALYQLHREEEARATVTRLHDLLRQVEVPELERKELNGFLKELEELIPGSAFPKPVDHPSDDRALYPITTMAPTWLVEQSTPDGGICKPVRIDWLQMSRTLGLPKAA
ncbi:MAG: hypothetical protein VX435_08190 [Planctomycetota bacterium]|nr:hypothetical protein [Planctomycetota bacterium]